MSTINLLPSDIEDDLRTSVRKLLAARCDAAVLSAMSDGEPGPEGLWDRLTGELGLAGLLVPEERGGAGATAREAAVVLAEIGAATAPVPYLTSAVVATTVALADDGDLVERLASGETVAALAVPFSAGPGGALRSVTSGEGGLTGTVRSVAGAPEADLLLVPVETDGGVDVHVVEASAVAVDVVPSLDMTRPVADITLDGVAGHLLIAGADGRAAVDRALLTGAALLASEQVGIARWCLETTVGYLQERRQFGRVVGGYQALKHRLADMYVDLEMADAAATYAAATIAEGDPDVPVAASVAQAFCSDVAVKAAEEAVQLHGGIGMTWEHPAHLRLKRAKADQIALGTPGAHRALLAELVDLPGPERS